MKNSLLKIMAFVLVLFLVTCEDDSYKIPSDVVEGPSPVASFTNSIDYLAVQFTSTSSNAESYHWDFGDGVSSVEASPLHTYAAAGTYHVTLKVKSAAGYEAQTESSFFVAGKVAAFFSYTPQVFREGKFGRVINFDGTASANVALVTWDFGDGSAPVEGEYTPTHEYANFGTYTVTVYALGLLDDEASFQAQVNVVPNYEMLRGGSMEAADADFWTEYTNSGSDYPTEWGYTADGPSGGIGGCLRFVGRTSTGSWNRSVYQAIEVVEGEKFQLSAQVKWGDSWSNGVLFWCIADDSHIQANGHPRFNDGDPYNNLFISSVSQWSTTIAAPAYDNDLSGYHKDGTAYGNGYGGPGRHRDGYTYGVYTATFTGTVYLGIEMRNANSPIHQSDFFVDEVSFKFIPE